MVVHLLAAWFTDIEGAFICPRPLMCVDLTDENPTAKDNIDDTFVFNTAESFFRTKG